MQKLFNVDLAKYFLCIPFAYTVESRSKSVRDLLANAVTSWAPGIILILSLTDAELKYAVAYYFAGYLAFVCVYEIGYLINDNYGVMNDPTPRPRVTIQISPSFLATFITIRICVFVAIGLFGNVFTSTTYLCSYAALLAIIALHNMIVSVEYKFLTFLQMSTLRFSIPILYGLIVLGHPGAFLQVLALGIFVFVYPRFLTYLESKDRLILPERREKPFPINTLLLMLPVMSLFSVVGHSYSPIYVWAWLVFAHLFEVIWSYLSYPPRS